MFNSSILSHATRRMMQPLNAQVFSLFRGVSSINQLHTRQYSQIHFKSQIKSTYTHTCRHITTPHRSIAHLPKGALGVVSRGQSISNYRSVPLQRVPKRYTSQSVEPPQESLTKAEAHQRRWDALPWYKKPFISRKYVLPGDELPVSFRGVWAVLALSIIGSLYLKYRETKTVAQAKVLTYQVSGKLDLGGPFDGLYDTDGKEATSEQYKGLYPLIYFGFTNCPDICPTELRKMMAALDMIERNAPDVYPYIKPIFISVDPLRDTRERLTEYSKEYHPRIRWLTGTYDKLLEVAKRYRVYFSIPEDATPDSEYNVDHSIFFFLMDKKGELLQYYGQNKTAAEIADLMSGVVREDLAKRDEQYQSSN